MDGDRYFAAHLGSGTLRAVTHSCFNRIVTCFFWRIGKGIIRIETPEIQFLFILVECEGIGIAPVSAFCDDRPGNGIICHICIRSGRDICYGYWTQCNHTVSCCGRGVPHSIGSSHGQRIRTSLKGGILVAGIFRGFPGIYCGIALSQYIGISIRILPASCLGVPVNGVLRLRFRQVRIERFKAQFLQQDSERFCCKRRTVIISIQHIYLQGIICGSIGIRAEDVVCGISLRRRLLSVNKQFEAVAIGFHTAFRRRCPGNSVIQVCALLIGNSGYLQATFWFRNDEVRTNVIFRYRIFTVPDPNDHVIRSSFGKCVGICIVCTVAGLFDPRRVFIQCKLISVGG